MRTDKVKKVVQDILFPAGIAINGGNPWDIRIKDDRFYKRVITEGSLGLGESYMDGWWECEKLDDFFCRLIPSRPEDKIRRNWKLLIHFLGAVVISQGRNSYG